MLDRYPQTVRSIADDVPCGVGLVRPLGRRLAVAPRAVLPGSEHIADLAAHASRWVLAAPGISSSASSSSSCRGITHACKAHLSAGRGCHTETFTVTLSVTYGLVVLAECMHWAQTVADKQCVV